VHAIGDRANARILDAFELALQGVNVTALRPRLEHAQLLTEADMKRVGKLGGRQPLCSVLQVSLLRYDYLKSLRAFNLRMCKSPYSLTSLPHCMEIQHKRYVVR
jgi:predicted amidohydrolase YtcJ